MDREAAIGLLLGGFECHDTYAIRQALATGLSPTELINSKLRCYSNFVCPVRTLPSVPAQRYRCL